MAEVFLSQVAGVKVLQSDIALFGAEVARHCFSTYGEISEYCHSVHGQEKSLKGTTSDEFKSNGERIGLRCEVPACCFRIVCTKSKKKLGDNFFALRPELTVLEHTTSEGLPCGGIRKISVEELTQNVIYLAQKQGDASNKRGKNVNKTVKSSQRLVAKFTGFAEPTENVVKQANSRIKISPAEHLTSYQLLIPYCEQFKDQNPEFKYKIDRGQNEKMLRMMVLLPFSIPALSACFNVVGIDTAHMGTIKLGNTKASQIEELCGYVVGEGGGYLLEKLVVTMVAGRTFNNEMIVFAYCIGYTENSVDMHHFFRFLVESEFPINRLDMTIMTDRSMSYKGPIEFYFPLSLHFLCPLHIQRNLTTNVPGAGPQIISVYWQLQRARSEAEYSRIWLKLLAMGPKGIRASKYLENIKGCWQLYKVDSRHNVLYDMKSSNIVESVFAWGLDLRSYGSAYYFTSQFMRRMATRINEMKTAMSILDPNTVVTSYAMLKYTKSLQKARVMNYEASISSSADKPVVGFVTQGIPPRTTEYSIDFSKRTCPCLYWQQTGVPCMHACTLLLKAPGGPLTAKQSDFYNWCYIKPLAQMIDDIAFILPYSDDVLDRQKLMKQEDWVLVPSVIRDPTATASSARIASKGDKVGGGGQSYSQIKSREKVPCGLCGRLLSGKTTSHDSIRCEKYARRHGFMPDLHNYTLSIICDIDNSDVGDTNSPILFDHIVECNSSLE